MRSGATPTGATGRRDLPHTQLVEVGGGHLYVLHELFCLDLDPPPPASMRSSSATPTLPTQNAKTASSTSTPAAPAPGALPLPVTLARIKLRASPCTRNWWS